MNETDIKGWELKNGQEGKVGSTQARREANLHTIKNHPTKEFSGKGERRRRRRKVLRVGTQPWPDDYFLINYLKSVVFALIRS
ncbi:MAG: hypothetical protein ACYTG7_20735 [Planctomycetota bacterium]|jgi:hypothetical protein